MAFYQFYREQMISASIDEVWDFISSPQNLKKITPKEMGFDIRTKDLPNRIYEGMIISYTVKPILGIKTNWVTEITHVKDKEYFVDEQRIGPYSMWHHQHMIKKQGNHVIMKDIDSYQPPFGFLGAMANKMIIENKLNEIFDYRTQVLNKLFPSH
ncbi:MULTISPECIES: SRPBCC family protein [unclassified Lentimicrobium]|uniref:SRPBCC family protein n=1 Tax=unclassified Lentimicrobium TaxID=2677434 RepID=UPI00155676B7|nr:MULTISPECIES: SRPBCC family protein [unclassified Lentimicrobium]NPD45436.1 SRPBCC family protein [Lentimicrobium sp. S6]NPD83798.1 SRPBCC family protein [Lentimicrobium sp. L6]